MKRIFRYAILALLICMANVIHAQQLYPISENGDLTLPLTQVGDRTISLKVNVLRGDVVLIIPANNNADVTALLLLKDEVLRIVNSTVPISLGDSGFTFIFQGGYPKWGPYTTNVQGGGTTFKCLFFAQGAVINGKEITAKGNDAPAPYSWYGTSSRVEHFSP